MVYRVQTTLWRPLRLGLDRVLDEASEAWSAIAVAPQLDEVLGGEVFKTRDALTTEI